MSIKRSLILVSVLLAADGGAAAPGSDLAEIGRDIFSRNRTAVVTVEVVLKTTYSAGGQTSAPAESKLDVTGTVVDSSGLAVLALSACDPSELYQRMTAQQSKYKVDAEVSDLKILLEDGTELPAEIVLRDKDLDLAFVRPKSRPASALAAIDLGQSGTAQVLDEVITINRLNKAASRAYAASVERISAVVQKPRTFYIPETTSTTTMLGSPAFLMNGKLLGIFVLRAVNSSTGGAYNYRENVTSIILPADAILKAAKQVPEPKDTAAEKKEPSKESNP